jgi:hypothetical protein
VGIGERGMEGNAVDEIGLAGPMYFNTH